MKNLFFVLAILVMTISFSCKKSAVEKSAPPPPPASPLVTAAGTSDGVANSKLIIAANGGTITSTDGKITVNIPAGALSNNETISIQPVTNTTGLGKSKTYRLTPHGITFNKPVTISFPYTDADIEGTIPELLRIVFQDNAGVWQSMNKTQVNKQTTQLSVTTTHFSDWNFVPLVHIEPIEARIAVNETVELKVIYSFDPEEIFVPLQTDNSPLGTPQQMSADYLKKWLHSGAGTLTSNGSKAVYRAPATAPVQNPVAVSAEINFKQAQTYIIVANITILSEFHIDYLQVDETEINMPQLQRGSQLYIYGNFGNDPGANKRSVKIGNVPLVVKGWTPKIIICDISAEGPSSSGEVVVSSGNETSAKLLNEWIVDFNYAKKESPDGSLTRKTKFVLRFRGDAIGFGSDDTEPLIPYTDLNKASKAIIDMPAGNYSNAVSNDACGVYKVQWGAVNQHVTNRSLYATGDGFSGRVFQTATGFGVKIKFESDAILKSTRIFTPCVGAVYTTVVNEPIVFQGYHEETIWFPFATQAARAAITAGSPPIQVGTGVAPGLFWDVEDLNVQVFTTKIWWAEEKPKYD
jgi:hypothetical protein